MFELSIFDEDVLLGRSDHDCETLEIGSGPGAGARLDAADILAIHARIERRETTWLVVPLATIAVNDREVSAACELKSGDKIKVGRFTLVFGSLADAETRRSGSSSSGDADKPTETHGVPRPVAPPSPSPDAELGKTITEPREPRAPKPVVPPKANEPRKLGELIGIAEQKGIDGLGLKFPVIISRASLSLAEAGTALIYELGAMQATAKARQKLDDEIDRLTIGRARESDIVVSDISVSKHHAALVRRARGRWSIFDDTSANGTFIDGSKVEPQEMVDIAGQLATLRFGPSARFAFMQEDAFKDYMRELLAERERQKNAPPTTRARLTDKTPLPSAARERTQLQVKQKPISQDILRRAEGAPFIAKSYKVVLEEARVEELDSWSELVAFVEENAATIIELEAVPDHGKGVVVYKRPGSAKR